MAKVSESFKVVAVLIFAPMLLCGGCLTLGMIGNDVGVKDNAPKKPHIAQPVKKSAEDLAAQKQLDEAVARHRAATEHDAEREVFFRSEVESVVKKFLKYPNDASFGWFSTITKYSPNEYRVVGNVTVQNSFGAKFKQEYRVSFVLADEEKQLWNPSLVVLDNKVLYTRNGK